jgi:hypothetical protein
MSEPTALRVFERSVFWIAYVLGTLILVFAFLLAQVPRPRHGANFTLDYVCWSLATSFLVVSLVAAKFTWTTWNPLKRRGVSSPSQLFIGAAWIELASSLYGILSLATSR